MKRRNFLNSAGVAAGSLLLGRAGLSFPYQENFNFSDIDDDKLWEEVRGHFLYSKNLCYLNTAGNGALPDSVLNELSKAMKHDAMHPGPGTKGEKWEAVKKKCAKLISNDIDNSEIALTGSTTEGCNIIINGLPLKKGDEVITSTHAHPAVIVPLLNRMKRDGVVLRTFDPDLINASGNIEKIKALINRRTKLIFISHITFTTGQIFPIKEIGQLAKENDIWFAVDGAQAVGNIPIEIKDSNVDFYTFGGCKWLVGPKRTGVLVWKYIIT
ncbi:MAG: aminotransferase class V-fold PLP-dependent enzyme [Bacteroidales bacterium]|nr:aminotransferase class V-fold PLP-dependent enzyme [Bacteroidales bacterium]